MSTVLAYIIKGNSVDVIDVPNTVLQYDIPVAVNFTNIKLVKDDYAAEHTKGSDEPFVRSKDNKKRTLLISAREDLGDGRFRLHNVAIDGVHEPRAAREVRRNLPHWVARHIHAEIDMKFCWEESKGRFWPVSGNKALLERAIGYCWAFSDVLQLTYQRVRPVKQPAPVEDDTSYVRVSREIEGVWEMTEGDVEEDEEEEEKEEEEEEEEEEESQSEDEEYDSEDGTAVSSEDEGDEETTAPASTPAPSPAPKADEPARIVQAAAVTHEQQIARLYRGQWWLLKDPVAVFRSMQISCLGLDKARTSLETPTRPDYAAKVVHSFANGALILNTGVKSWSSANWQLEVREIISTEGPQSMSGGRLITQSGSNALVFPGHLAVLSWNACLTAKPAAKPTTVKCRVILDKSLVVDVNFHWGTIVCMPRSVEDIAEDAGSLYATACEGLKREAGKALDFSDYVRERISTMERTRQECLRAQMGRIQAELRHQKLLFQLKEDAEGRAKKAAEKKAAAAAEEERLRNVAAAAAKESERIKAAAAAEEERMRNVAVAAAKESERIKAAAAAEEERLRNQAAAAAKERERIKAAAAIEEERLRNQAAAAAKERERLEAAAAEEEFFRRQAAAAAETRLRKAAAAAQEEEEKYYGYLFDTNEWVRLNCGK